MLMVKQSSHIQLHIHSQVQLQVFTQETLCELRNHSDKDTGLCLFLSTVPPWLLTLYSSINI